MLSAKSVVPMNKQFHEMANLAAGILREYYTKFHPIDRVNSWIQAAQSSEKIKEDASKGMEYYFLKVGDKNVGYVAIQPQQEKLFLSKFYVDSNFRKAGVGKHAIEFIEEFGKKNNLKSIYCYCGSYNKESIKAYERLGFNQKGKIITPVEGSNRVCEESIMQKKIV